MKHITLTLFSLFFSFTLFAQDKVADLVSEGIKLHDAAKYQEAIAKYKEALALEPNHPTANYEIAFTHFSNQSGKEAIPYLNKIIDAKSPNMASAYDLLGSIHDDQGQTDKAIECFKLCIKADPKYQRLYFNLAITYSRQGKNEEASQYASQAIQLAPGHASSHRLYAATAMANPNTKIIALIAYCNFLLLEATTERSVNAYKDLKSILGDGINKKDGVNNITVSNNDKDPDLNAANMIIPMSSLSLDAIPGLSETEKLEQQLKTIFSAAGELSAKKKEKSFFWSFYADYFYKIAKSEYMPLVTRIISFTANQEENRKWITEHQQQLKDFTKWQNENVRL